MFKESLSDPTAGQTAQLKRVHPEVPQPILDPTDPRYGAAAIGVTLQENEAPRWAPVPPRRRRA